jgi:exopolysaccharide biosynthesis predicted pyruvyltransferase EpsI
MAADAGLIADLSRIARQALEPYDTDEPYALVDFPNHSNVGDSAIWAGEIAYLRKYAPRLPSYVCSLGGFSMDELLSRCPGGPIFIHGGGNFGDVWPHHQTFRNRLLELAPGRPVIQLPQSIHFSSQEKLDEAARAIERHGRFTLFVRDKESLELARKHFPCETILCPDMAFFIGPIARPRSPELDVLCLLRTDLERVEFDNAALSGPSLRIADWLDEPKLELNVSRALGALGGVASGGPAALQLGIFNAAAEARVRRGARLLSSGRAVVTDRLHTHIISLLLGIPHAVLDNSYGKVTRFMSCWTSASTLTHRCDSMAAAVDWARTQAAGARAN